KTHESGYPEGFGSVQWAHVHCVVPFSPGCIMRSRELPLDEIFLGDCRNLLSRLPDGCVDLVVSSPPYNLGKEYEAKRALEVYLSDQAEVLRECARVLAPAGSLFWQVGAFA